MDDELLENMDKMSIQLLNMLPDEIIEDQVIRMVLIYGKRHDMMVSETWEHFAKLLYHRS